MVNVWARQPTETYDFDLDRLEMWAGALESGRYIQVRHAMRAHLLSLEVGGEEYGYCSLGVAALVAHEADPEIPLPWDVLGKSLSYPSNTVNNFYGGELRLLQLPTGGLYLYSTVTPAWLNDTARATFEEIATAIRSYVAEHRAAEQGANA